MQKIAVVTGGSHGIGQSTARLLSQNGFKVYEFSRSGSNQEGVSHLTVDLTDDVQIRNAIQTVVLESGRLDLLVNNAGNGVSGAVEFLDEEQTQQQFSVNLFGMLRVIRHALPALRQSKGMIINISSAAAIFPIPFQAHYSASKAAVNAITLALANEVRPHGVRVCAVMPGDIKTDFTAARQRCTLGAQVYGEALDHAVKKMEQDEQNGMSPQVVAKAIVRLAQRKHPRPLTVVGFQYRCLAVFQKFFPTAAVNFLVGKIYGKNS